MGAIALELQHLEPQIVERINGFFGYRAVAKIKLIHAAPLTIQKPAVRPRDLTMDEELSVMTTTAAVEDEELRATLERFGRSLLARPRPAPRRR